MHAYFRFLRSSSLFGLVIIASLAHAAENSNWTIDSRSLPTPAAASGVLSSMGTCRHPTSPPAASIRPAISNGGHSLMQQMRPGSYPQNCQNRPTRSTSRKVRQAALEFTRSLPLKFRQNTKIDCSFTSMAALMCWAGVITLWRKRQESKRLLKNLIILIFFLILWPSVTKAVTKCRNHH